MGDARCPRSQNPQRWGQNKRRTGPAVLSLVSFSLGNAGHLLTHELRLEHNLQLGNNSAYTLVDCQARSHEDHCRRFWSIAAAPKRGLRLLPASKSPLIEIQVHHHPTFHHITDTLLVVLIHDGSRCAMTM